MIPTFKQPAKQNKKIFALRDHLLSIGYDFKNSNVFWNFYFLEHEKFIELEKLIYKKWDKLKQDKSFVKVFKRLKNGSKPSTPPKPR